MVWVLTRSVAGSTFGESTDRAPDVPICAAPVTTTLAVLARRSVRGEVRENADYGCLDAASNRVVMYVRDRGLVAAAARSSTEIRGRSYGRAWRRGPGLRAAGIALI